MEPERLKTLIKKYLGIPYQHAGRDLTGLDCLGLVYYFYKDCGIDIPDGDGEAYSFGWSKKDPERYLRGILKIGKEAPINDLKPLDFVYFRLGRYITHGAVMVDSEQFLHVLQNTTVHLSRLDRSWRRRLAGARRLI